MVRKHSAVAAMMLALGLAACGTPPAPDNAAAPAAEVEGNATAPAPASPPAAATPAATAPSLAIEGAGLRLVDGDSGRTRPLPFGTAEAATLAALGGHGTPRTGDNAECPAGPARFARYPDGLLLTFQDGKFVGWSLDGRDAPKLTTLSGVGIGSTRARIEDANTIAVTEGSLGQEFTMGDIAGLLDGTGPGAKVTDLWAGVTCIAR